MTNPEPNPKSVKAILSDSIVTLAAFEARLRGTRFDDLADDARELRAELGEAHRLNQLAIEKIDKAIQNIDNL